MAKNIFKDSMASYNAKSTRTGFTCKPQAVLSASYNPKSLTELSANKLEQMIQPKLTKPKSLVRMT